MGLLLLIPYDNIILHAKCLIADCQPYIKLGLYIVHMPVLTMYVYYYTATPLTFYQIHILLSVMTVYWIYGL
jgi:hypothetical protein